MKKKITPFIEYFSESTTACLVTMVQGNLLSLSFTHFLIASQTGVFAGLLSGFVIVFAKVKKIEFIAVVVAIFTAIVDFYSHPAMFGSIAVEALITGAAAGGLSYIFALLYRIIPKKSA